MDRTRHTNDRVVENRGTDRPADEPVACADRVLPSEAGEPERVFDELALSDSMIGGRRSTIGPHPNQYLARDRQAFRSPTPRRPIQALPAQGSPSTSRARAEFQIRKGNIERGVVNMMRCKRARSKPATQVGQAISGVPFSLVGLVMTFGGRLSPEGSAVDVLPGLGLILCGSLLLLRRLVCAWAYMLAFAGVVSRLPRNIAVESGPTRGLIGLRAELDEAVGSPDRPPYSFPGRPDERTSAMIYDWQASLRASDYYAGRIVPPATVKEAGWDILLALHSDRHCRLHLGKLASIVSVSDGVMNRWLGALEESKLIAGERHPPSEELLAVLTDKGRELLDRYFSATKDLQLGAHC